MVEKLQNTHFLPGAGAQHWREAFIVPKIDFHIDQMSYGEIFSRWGVNDKTVKMCQILAKNKVAGLIDNMSTDSWWTGDIPLSYTKECPLCKNGRFFTDCALCKVSIPTYTELNIN
jgi:hypothetical protein